VYTGEVDTSLQTNLIWNNKEVCTKEIVYTGEVDTRNNKEVCTKEIFCDFITLKYL
jgi:hypothetical protein